MSAVLSPRILSLLVIVLVLGVVLRLDLTTRPLDVVAYDHQTVIAPRAGRDPASVPSEAENLSGWKEPDHVATIEWDCLQKNKSKPFQNIAQVRVTGNCLKDVKSITNNNNGYTANIFKIEKGFTTDYLGLEVGTNQLKIEWQDGASSNHSEKLEIIVEKQ
jgi:hypothetical protein